MRPLPSFLGNQCSGLRVQLPLLELTKTNSSKGNDKIVNVFGGRFMFPVSQSEERVLI